jgi:hypothetical protein
MMAIHSLRTDLFRPALESQGGPLMIAPMLKVMGLSSWTIRQHFDSFTLVTDDAGAEMAKQCKLPYTKIVSVGENFDSDPCFWTHSKFTAYANNQPFIHFDNDLFLWDPLPTRILEAPVAACNSDTYMWGVYAEHIRSLEESLGVGGLHRKHFTNRMPINMAIFGGNDITAINSFSKLVLDFVADRNGFRDLNEEQKVKLMRGMHVIEQLWGSCFLQNELGIPVELALSEEHIQANKPSTDVRLTHVHGLKYAAQAQSNAEAIQTLNKVSMKLSDLAPEIALAIVDYGMVFDSQIGTNNDSNLPAEATHS